MDILGLTEDDLYVYKCPDLGFRFHYRSAPGPHQKHHKVILPFSGIRLARTLMIEVLKIQWGGRRQKCMWVIKNL